MTSRAVPGRDATATEGNLAVIVDEDRKLTVHFPAKEPLEAHVALLGMGIVSKVRAGENRGRELRHDFVVLRMGSVAMRDGAADLRLPEDPDPAVPRHAVVVWVTRPGQTAPLQATGGWLD
jgi:hypothetical protein